jgi:ferredoxin/flavodoxin---NADP+ reductase
VDLVVDPADIELDRASRTVVEEDRTARANLKILREYAARDRHGAQRRNVLRFLSSPAELVGRRGRITGLRVERNELVVDAYGGLRSKGTGQFDLIETGLVVRSIGYRTVPIEGGPFDPATSTVEVMVADLPDLKGVRDDHRDPSRIEVCSIPEMLEVHPPRGLTGHHSCDHMVT